ncbi:hypothetical protein H6P81_008304 [Aristolochia fimbriata]|uniref:Uncharacterized protein n=1 Tax=Aristolochia fimbriata TaxID=158543 RepID=A0AAV7F2N0_ARIFI|nr:hypothetical protein H6P81_008304 [Aristolochia fimbriata]
MGSGLSPMGGELGHICRQPYGNGGEGIKREREEENDRLLVYDLERCVQGKIQAWVVRITGRPCLHASSFLPQRTAHPHPLPSPPAHYSHTAITLLDGCNTSSYVPRCTELNKRLYYSFRGSESGR